MARISEDTIQAVAAANDVVTVIGEYIQLKRAGANWKGLCPFHNEKTPSFLVNPGRQTYKCFGCGAGGGVFRFVMDYEKVDYPTAVRKLAAKANITIAEASPEDEARRGERDRLLALHRDVTAWFHENLMRQKFADHARAYLKGRGISQEVAVRWKLGYAPDEWSALSDWGRRSGYSEGELVRAGLVLTRDRGDGTYDRFRNRVMFPICNDYGEVIGFSGRTLGDDPAKYVNSPETPIFVKGRVLFGLDKSKRAILAANKAVVCEGQLDLISAFEAGIQNVTAPQGTAFTAQQARLLRQVAETVILCFDSDAAGKKAVERSLPALLGAGVAVRVARVPAGEDPDSLIRNQGADALRAVITSARDYFDDVVEDELPPGASPQQKAALARKLAGFVKLIDDPALREAISSRVQARLGLTQAAFSSLVQSAALPNPDREPETPAFSVKEIVLPEPARLLCRIAILSPEAREWLRNQPDRAEVFGDEYTVVDRLTATETPIEDPAVFSAFLSSLPEAEERALAGLHLGKLPEAPVEVISGAWKGLFRFKLQSEIATLQARMRHPDTALEEVTVLHKQILDLQARLGHS